MTQNAISNIEDTSSPTCASLYVIGHIIKDQQIVGIPEPMDKFISQLFTICTFYHLIC